MNKWIFFSKNENSRYFLKTPRIVHLGMGWGVFIEHDAYRMRLETNSANHTR